MNKLLKQILWLSIITILYNFIEGIVSIFFGAKDSALTLLGFGLDSIVEIISGIGILHLALRMKYSQTDKADKFERTALRITGTGFIVLAIGLTGSAIFNLINNQKPETTLAGIIISIISIVTMYWLMKSKFKVGKALKSDAIIEDAHCTKICLYLSIILLTSSLLYSFVHIGFIDVIGSLGIAYYAFHEGKESFERIKSDDLDLAKI